MLRLIEDRGRDAADWLGRTCVGCLLINTDDARHLRDSADAERIKDGIAEAGLWK